MLKGIDPRLNAEVLHALRAMGHGDMLILADTNFPADAIAHDTVWGGLLHMDNLTCGQAAEAVLSVMPLKPATKTFAGRSYRSSGAPTCSIWPPCMTTIRSAIVIASIWSWVT